VDLDVDAMPARSSRYVVVGRAWITAKDELAANAAQNIQQSHVLSAIHFAFIRVARVGFARLVQVGRIAIEQGFWRVQLLDKLGRFGVPDLDALQAGMCFGQAFDSRQPGRDVLVHPAPRAAGWSAVVFAETLARLSIADEERNRAFDDRPLR